MKAAFVIVVIGLLTAGCSTVPQTQNMVPLVTSDSPARFHAPLQFGEIKGGSTDSWSETGIGAGRFLTALQQSFQRANYFDAGAPADKAYRLDVIVMGQEQPSVGLNMTCRLGVRYTLTKAAGGEPVWTQEIFSDYTESCCGTPIGAVRARKASEGVARTNIGKLLDEIGKLKLD